MFNLETDRNSANDSAFEDVDLQTFLNDSSEENPAIHAIIAKIANNNPTVATGIESLMHCKLIFHSFERALSLLITAKDERVLQNVEAALQVTMKDVKTYNMKGSPYMGKKETSLYLYTLQTMILNLGKWKFPNKRHNTFKPNLLTKLEFVRMKCTYAGIEEEVIRSQCFTTAYQQPYDKYLRSFEYLDEQRLDSFIIRVRRYESTQNPADLYDRRSSNEVYNNEQKSNILNKIISYIESKFRKKMSLDFYTRNYVAVNEVISQYIGSNELQKICNIADMLKQYLESREQFKATLNGRIM